MMTRILFLTPHLPYPTNRGTAIRNFGLIRGLAERGHAVALISFLEEDQPEPEETPLAALCDPLITLPAPRRTIRRRLLDLLAGRADMARRRWSEGFTEALRGLLGRQTFDVIQIEGIEMAPYLESIQEHALDAALIYDAHNAEYALQQRIAGQDLRLLRRWPQAAYSLIQALRLRRFEAATCRAVDHIFACSEADAEKLRRLPHRTPITVIPNAIRAEEYRSEAQEEVTLPRPLLVFTGKMDFRPNVDAVLWFAGEILPRIREAIPGVHFAIVGQKPHRRLDALRGRAEITVTGFVPQIQPYLRAADVYVAPLRMGSGTRLKLLEAMAMGCAVVSTRLGAEGFPLEDGRHLLLADTPEAFAGAVIRLLENEAQRRRLGEDAARLVRERYNWPAIIPLAEAIYFRLTRP
ncbi:MAG TPA: glycosyltransferase [Chloroflexi bacterium]|nr:glycosyltransferase [Chloroflexota bacterium]